MFDEFSQGGKMDSYITDRTNILKTLPHTLVLHDFEQILKMGGAYIGFSGSFIM